MEKFAGFNVNDEPIELPPGFRFHPTDEELITHYLSPKILDSSFSTKVVTEADLNKVEPWDLPWKAKIGEKEWYFFCIRDRKYPTGLRTNRATDAGYWKATGKDREIFREKILVGMKKTLVFYRGRAPRGEKTNWVMHEYRLNCKNSNHHFSKSANNEWVLCRIFKKSSGGKKVHISGLVRSRNCGAEELPPLMDLSSDENQTRTTAEGSYVTCFSNPMEDKFVDEFSSFPCVFPKVSTPNSIYVNYPDSGLVQNESRLLENSVSNTKQNVKPEFLQDMSCLEVGFKPYEDQEFPNICSVPVDLDCLWDY